MKRKKFSRIILIVKFNLLILPLMLIIFFGISYIVVNIEEKTLIDSMKENGNQLAESFARMCALSIKQFSLYEIEKNAKQFEKNSDIVSVGAFNNSGGTYTASFKDISKTVKNFNEKYVLIEKPIIDDKNKEIGNVKIILTLENIYKKVNQTKSIFIFVFAGALIVLAVILFLGFKFIITNPLKKLVSTTEVISKGNLNQLVLISSRDELGELATSFNNMTNKLKNSFTKIEEQNIELKKLDKLKDEFLANTSHELRTPLNGITGLAESIIDGADGPINDKLKEHMIMIRDSSKRLINLVNDILDFSKIKAGKMELNVTQFNIVETIKNVILIATALIENKDIEIKQSFENENMSVYGDKDKIVQVLLNLVSNAIKFTKKGFIEINTTYKDEYVLVKVTDTGIGIKPENISEIFDEFKQVDGSSSREFGGTGLGLAITKNIVALHGGILGVESEYNVGSTFYFTIPTKIEQVKPIEVKIEMKTKMDTMASVELIKSMTVDKGKTLEKVSESEEKDTTQRKDIGIEQVATQEANIEKVFKEKILVVDDEPVNVEVIRSRLTLHNYQVLSAEDGFKGLEIAKAERPDLILLDIMMPGMSGYEFCQRLKSDYLLKDIPVIMLTAKSNLDDKIFGLNLGADDYLTKPFNKEELVAKIKSLIRFKSLQIEQAKIKQELEVARTIQELFIPNYDPQCETMEFSSFYQPAESTSGDWYGYINDMENQKIGIYIGDVTGHGVPSALVTALVYTAMKQRIIETESLYNSILNIKENIPKDLLEYFHRVKADALSPKKILEVLNRLILESSKKGLAMTFFASVFDIKTRELTFSNASHNYPLIYRKSNISGKTKHRRKLENLIVRGPLLGSSMDSYFKEVKTYLGPGDIVFWYTDGLIECENPKGEQYTKARLEKVIIDSVDLPAREIKENIIKDAFKFFGDQPRKDDIAFIIGKAI